MKSRHSDINEQIALARKAGRAGNPTVSLEHATQACRLALQHNDTLWYDYARLCVAVSYGTMHKYSLALPIYHEVWESIETNFGDVDILWMYANYSATCGDTGDMKNALYYAHKGIELATEKQYDRQLMGLSYAAATAYARMYHYSRTFSLLDTVISLSKKLNDHRYLISALTQYASVLMEINDRERAIQYFHEALGIAKQNEHFRAAIILHYLSLLHPDQTSIEKLELSKEAVAVARKSNLVRYTVMSLAGLGEWYMKNNQPEEAEKYYREILDIAQQADTPYNYWLGHYRLAELYHQMGEYPTAREQIRTAEGYLNQLVLNEQRRDTYHLWYLLEKSCGNDSLALEWHEKLNEVEHSIAQQKQEETSKAVLIVARVDELRQQLTEEQKAVRELKALKEEQAREALSLSLELEEKKQTIRKIKKIADSSISKEKNLSGTKGTPTVSSEQDLKKFVAGIGDNDSLWEGFKKNLERIHPEFTKRLLEHCPELTPTQIRVCCLLRLQLRSKEIVEVMNLSRKTVDHHREHIRKRFGIPPSVNLTSYLLNI